MIWFTSDWHFGHRNVIDYCNRPFATVEEMNEKLVQLWNTTIKPEDEVWFLGDFSMNPRWSSEMLSKLNGIKYLVCGNHDAVWPYHKKSKLEKMRKRYLEDGWKELHVTTELTLKNGQRVLLSHLPYASEDGARYDNRYAQYKPTYSGLPLLHGHLHKHYLKLKNMIDVGIDGEFKILSEDDVIELLNDPREFIPSAITEFYKTRQEQGSRENKGLSKGRNETQAVADKIEKLDKNHPSYNRQVQAVIKRFTHTQKADVYNRMLVYFGETLTKAGYPTAEEFLKDKIRTHSDMSHLPDSEVLTWKD